MWCDENQGEIGSKWNEPARQTSDAHATPPAMGLPTARSPTAEKAVEAQDVPDPHEGRGQGGDHEGNKDSSRAQPETGGSEEFHVPEPHGLPAKNGGSQAAAGPQAATTDDEPGEPQPDSGDEGHDHGLANADVLTAREKRRDEEQHEPYDGSDRQEAQRQLVAWTFPRSGALEAAERRLERGKRDGDVSC